MTTPKVGLGESIRAAFSARPIGMFVPPNWVGLTVFAGLGFLNPGFWVVGLGLELGYLYSIGTSARFRRWLKGKKLLEARGTWEKRRAGIVAQLDTSDRERYEQLEERCRGIVKQQAGRSAGGPGVSLQSDGLSRLAWIYLRLLLTRQSIERVVQVSYEAERGGPRIEERLAELDQRLADDQLRDDLRKSLASQADILRQRLEKRQEASRKLEFLDAELTRIQEQVELIREQAALSTDPEAVSDRIDNVTATLGGTTQWIKEQQRLYGSVEDLLTEPPPLVIDGETARESA